MTTATATAPAAVSVSTNTVALPKFTAGLPAAWAVADVENETRWIYSLKPAESDELISAVRRARVEGKPLIAYRKGDFNLRLLLAPVHIRCYLPVRTRI